MLHMRKPKYILLSKFFAILLVSCLSASLIFASSGGGKSKSKKSSSLLPKSNFKINDKFSLKSNYPYRGNQILNFQNSKNTITLNEIVTFQRGRGIIIIPIKTTVYTQKIKLSAGVPQMNKH